MDPVWPQIATTSTTGKSARTFRIHLDRRSARSGPGAVFLRTGAHDPPEDLAQTLRRGEPGFDRDGPDLLVGPRQQALGAVDALPRDFLAHRVPDVGMEAVLQQPARDRALAGDVVHRD